MAAALPNENPRSWFADEPAFQREIAKALQRILSKERRQYHLQEGLPFDSPSESSSADNIHDDLPRHAGLAGRDASQAQWVKVFTVLQEADPRHRDDDTRKRINSILQKIEQSEGFRPLRCADRSTVDMCDDLIEKFPNFKSVIDLVVKPHIVASSRALALRMPPVLLVGDPGVGKTFFASTLSKSLAVPFLKVDMACESNGSSLAGSSVFWGNASHGAVFDLLLRGSSGSEAVANPICFVDEVDKVNPLLTYNPLAGLYSLLEEDSAQTFVDQAVPGVVVNASNVRWIFSANSLSGIPEPILSRMLVIEIPPLNESQVRAIIQSIAQSAALKFGGAVSANVAERFVKDCMGRSTREIKLRLELAFAFAFAKQRSNIDDEAWAASAGVQSLTKKEKAPMGFT